MFHMRRVGELMILQTDLFPVSLKHAFTTKRLNNVPPGSKKCSDFRIDSINETSNWWTKLRDSLFTKNHTLVIHNQVHGGNVRVLDSSKGLDSTEIAGFKYHIAGDGDAIIKPFMRQPVFIGITTADCLPCIVFEPESHTVAVVHAGWRGIASDIHGNTIRAFKNGLGIEPKNLLWAIGPSIDAKNYEVGTDVIAGLEASGYAETDWVDNPGVAPCWTRSRRRDHFMLNLAECVKTRLISMGVPEAQIDICKLSTFDNPNLFN
ncbi:MAG: polyphenol oxidase family protein [bacterium]|nr:polyphenol oxidase family protein [bacterium]